MRNYTTQMDAAKRGIITPEMKAVAEKEYRTAEEIRELEDKCLIYTEPTEVILKDGKKRNGNLKYTIRPIQDAIEHYHYEQMKSVNEVAARAKAQKMLDDYNRKHPKATA